MACRSQIILAAAEGCSTEEIALSLDVRMTTVSKWRTRFAQRGIQGLSDQSRSGKPRSYTSAIDQQILAVVQEPPPAGYARWNGRLIAERLGDVTARHVWRVLQHHRVSLERRKSWCISTDPAFSAKASDIVGLYLAPPQNAMVICVDEKPGIQALERAQGWLRLPNGKALTGFSHEYVRHGTTTLFAALEVATGRVQTGHYNRRRRREFLAFMNGVVGSYPPDVALHVVLDNASTHKPKDDRWLRSHPNVHFHYTPTHASWLNQAEIWFSILARAALKGASFTSPKHVRMAIDGFVTAYSQRAQPFEWTKKTVHQQSVKNYIANLCH